VNRDGPNGRASGLGPEGPRFESGRSETSPHIYAHNFGCCSPFVSRITRAKTVEPKRCVTTCSGSNQPNPVEVEMAALSTITSARFWSKVAVKVASQECWLWQGARTGNGYGNFSVPEASLKMAAHRVAYWLKTGEPPAADLLVRHKCDVPLCVNPLHLEIGTVADNMRDMVERGRRPERDMRGEKNGAAKLTAANVEHIRELIAMGQTNIAIAKRFGVTHSMISRIRRQRSWAA
jgi:hypothetical protein